MNQDDTIELSAQPERLRFIEHKGHSILLIDLSNCPNKEMMLVLDRPYVKKSAWVGTENLPHVFYENFKSFSQRELPTFKTREEGLDWLVRE